MNKRRMEISLWCVAGALFVTAGLGARRSALGNVGGMGDGMPAGEQSAARRTPGPETAVAIVDHDPFRLQRHPSPIAYKPELEGVAPPPPAVKPPKPLLVLAGILGGPPWEALVEGIPGHEGSTLVRAGDVVAGLKVRAIRRDTVIIQDADTTWRLGLKRSWQ